MKQTFSLLLCLCIVTVLFQACATDNSVPTETPKSALSTSKATTKTDAAAPTAIPQAKEDRRNNVPTATAKEASQKAPATSQTAKSAQKTKKELLKSGEQVKIQALPATKSGTAAPNRTPKTLIKRGNQLLDGKKKQLGRAPTNMEEAFTKRGQAMAKAYCACTARESAEKCKNTLQERLEQLADKLPAEGKNIFKSSYEKAISNCK